MATPTTLFIIGEKFFLFHHFDDGVLEVGALHDFVFVPEARVVSGGVDLLAQIVVGVDELVLLLLELARVEEHGRELVWKSAVHGCGIDNN